MGSKIRVKAGRSLKKGRERRVPESEFRQEDIERVGERGFEKTFVRPLARAPGEWSVNKEIDVRHPSGSSRAETPWKIRDARERVRKRERERERGHAYYDQTSDQKIVNRDAFRRQGFVEQAPAESSPGFG